MVQHVDKDANTLFFFFLEHCQQGNGTSCSILVYTSQRGSTFLSPPPHSPFSTSLHNSADRPAATLYCIIPVLFYLSLCVLFCPGPPPFGFFLVIFHNPPCTFDRLRHGIDRPCLLSITNYKRTRRSSQ